MTKYRTDEDYAAALKKLNPVWELSGTYVGLDDVTEHKCLVCGIVECKRPTTVIHLKSRCKNCKRMKAHTNYVCTLSNINADVAVLGFFKSVVDPIDHKCLLCKRQWKTPPRLLLAGSGCLCQLKFSEHEYAVKLQSISNGIVALEPYKGSKVAILHKHETCGTEWKGHPNSILYNGARCPKCDVAFRAAGRAKPTQIDGFWFHSELEAQCFTILRDYFGPSDIVLQKRYLPDSRRTCDFYIQSQDLYIEVSAIRKAWYYERILNKRKLVSNFYFAGSTQQLELFLDGLRK